MLNSLDLFKINYYPHIEQVPGFAGKIDFGLSSGKILVFTDENELPQIIFWVKDKGWRLGTMGEWNRFLELISQKEADEQGQHKEADIAACLRGCRNHELEWKYA